MFQVRKEDKLCIVLDDDETINYCLRLDHLQKLFAMVNFAMIPNRPALATAELAKYEEYYGIQAHTLLQPNMTALEAAHAALARLQAMGTLPRVRDPRRFEYPQLEGDQGEELTELMKLSPKPTRTPSEHAPQSPTISTPYSLYVDTPSDLEQTTLHKAANEAALERRKKEQQAKQEKAAIEREAEAQRRKVILDQFEKDRLERIKQEEEKRSRTTEQQANGLSPLSSPSTLHVPSSSTTPTAGSAGNSPNISPRKSPQISHSTRSEAYQMKSNGSSTTGTTSGTASPTPYQSSGSPSPTLSNVNGSTPSHVQGYPGGPSASHFAPRPKSSTPSSHEEATIKFSPETIAQYHQIYRQMEADVGKAKQILVSIRMMKGQDSSGASELDKAIEKYENYINSSQMELTMLAALLNGAGSPIQSATDVTAPPSIPAQSQGFTLRGNGRGEEDGEEQCVEGVELKMLADQPIWKIRVHMPEGSNTIVLDIHPTHTVNDIFLHLATMTPLTTRFKLEIVGKPGILDSAITTEQAGLKMTTLRLSPK